MMTIMLPSAYIQPTYWCLAHDVLMLSTCRVSASHQWCGVLTSL